MAVVDIQKYVGLERGKITFQKAWGGLTSTSCTAAFHSWHGEPTANGGGVLVGDSMRLRVPGVGYF